METRYGAPWGTLVKRLTALGLGVSGVALFVVLSMSVGGSGYHVALGGTLVAAVAFTAAFTVRGFTIDGRTLEIHRLWWRTRLSLSGLRSVDHDPDAMRRSLRVFGNGGMFGVTGWFWNRSLRRYRAFVTDHTLAVVLRFEDRVVVVSPDPPEPFVEHVRKVCRLAS